MGVRKSSAEAEGVSGASVTGMGVAGGVLGLWTAGFNWAVLMIDELLLRGLETVLLGVRRGDVALADDFEVGLVTGLAAGFLGDIEDLVAVLVDFLARRVVRPSIDLFELIIYNYSMKGTKITKKQQAVLNFLEDYTEENGYSPSYREIMVGLGLSSVSAVAEHIDNMVAKGILKKVPGAARSLEVLDFRHTETVELFRTKLVDCSEEERKVLLAAADVLGLDLSYDDGMTKTDE